MRTQAGACAALHVKNARLGDSRFRQGTGGGAAMARNGPAVPAPQRGQGLMPAEQIQPVMCVARLGE